MSRKRRELRQLLIDGGYVVDAAVDLQSTWGGARKGAGRPRSSIETVTISIRVPVALAECARARARDYGRNLNTWLTELLIFELGLQEE